MMMYVIKNGIHQRVFQASPSNLTTLAGWGFHIYLDPNDYFECGISCKGENGNPVAGGLYTSVLSMNSIPV
jgi:hypothetical protein